mmetsp:Transcript_413/g.511  ORF Transcript_413/g.511 Transcript_413/m.511 type:complete len:97 (+) Transcript_413:621-911(+)
MTTNLTEGSLNSLDISKKSTLYTFIAEKGPIAGFQSHDDPARMPLPPFNEETALQKVTRTDLSLYHSGCGAYGLKSFLADRRTCCTGEGSGERLEY